MRAEVVFGKEKKNNKQKQKIIIKYKKRTCTATYVM